MRTIRYVLVLLFYANGFAFGFADLESFVGVRDMSSQAQNGKYFFVPHVGARFVFLNDSLVAPEFAYSFTRADYSGIKIQDHALLIGTKITPGSKSDFSGSFLAGISYFLTSYSGPVREPSSHVYAIYGGGSLSYMWGPLFFRLDITDHLHFGFKDSNIIVCFGLGMSL